MTPLRIVSFAAIALATAPAVAADLPNAPTETPGQGAAPPAPSWVGFYFGSGVSVVGGRGLKGGVGAEAFAGYDHAFDNNFVLGIKALGGYAPYLGRDPRFGGFSYVGTEATLGYRVGQVTPYLIAGVDALHPTRFGVGGLDPFLSANDVFAGPGAVHAVTTVGAGVKYQVNDKFSVGLEARMLNGN